MNEFKIQL